MSHSVTSGNFQLGKLAARTAVALAAVAAMGVAHAATDTTTFNVTLTVTESCTISTIAATNVAFANQARTAAALTLDANGGLNVNCTTGTAYNIGLNGGTNTTGAIAAPVAGNRRMRLGATANYVGYELYQNAGRTTFWGNTIGTSTLTGTGTGASVAIPVYGRVVSANVVAGAYTDLVTATVTY